ncbi:MULTISPECIES: hypothetical protein [Novosphingobium]|uniref:PRC-barrel domain-containing protein n=1 Tax=Novosphingobium subterraneum TaxID=48936 RepID=A0A0B9AGQ0_9SPHN|nr:MULTISPECIES: hypothetical protein [Novosphingobium]KHS48488.1 hypothetical protein NJ75_01160 [Novosphingobium subterraneum]
MTIRKLTVALLVATLPIATAANAQDAAAGTEATATAEATTAAPAAATPAVGAVVYDAAGAEVGKIKSVNAPNFVIDTGKNTATLALTALGTGPKGPVLGMTKVELDAAAEKAAAAAKADTAAAIVVDAPVYASDGTTQLGKVAEVTDTEFVLDAGTVRVKLPKTSVAKGASGLMIGMTAQGFADATKSADQSANAAAAKPAGK